MRGENLHECFNLGFDIVYRRRLELALCEKILLALREFFLF